MHPEIVQASEDEAEAPGEPIAQTPGKNLGAALVESEQDVADGHLAPRRRVGSPGGNIPQRRHDAPQFAWPGSTPADEPARGSRDSQSVPTRLRPV